MPDSGVTSAPSSERIILFDGVCNLCNGFVQFLIKRDPGATFRFGTLQSAAAVTLIQGNTSVPSEMDTVAYLRNGRVFTRSTAALYILKDLGGAWSLCTVFLIVPRPIRDIVYRFVSRKRYSWFGRQAQCVMPDPEIAERFLPASEHVA